MFVRFWGVRGSSPVASRTAMRYGGNTPCIEVCTGTGERLIFDAGTGIRNAGRRIAEATEQRRDPISILFTHYHWDHIQGLPFFEPLYREHYEVSFYGMRPCSGTIYTSLSQQMAKPFFPVDMASMRAVQRFLTIGEESFAIGRARITTRLLNHPQGALGYRIEDGFSTVVYASDHEHGSLRHDDNVRELAAGADLLIFDAQYTPDEYQLKKGWGHSTWKAAIQIAKDAGVDSLALFHHDPSHEDLDIDRIVAHAKQEFPSVNAAYEGDSFEFISRLSHQPANIDKHCVSTSSA